MVLRPRTRPLLRRAVAAAALGALLVPAAADAKAKPKAPVITKVTPKTALVGNKLTITGRYFKRGKATNSVLFRRDKGKALFVKADVSTTKKLTVLLPATLEKFMKAEGAKPVATRFRLRVLAFTLTKAYTRDALSPVIGPAKANGTDGTSDGAGVPTAPGGDCDNDGVKNGVDADDDNDLLDDTLELSLHLDPCTGDTDGDGVEDGFEYRSAVDLNDDDYQQPNYAIPYPGKTAYPNPLFKDADRDYDGDGLDLLEEYKLWKYTYQVNHTAARTLSPLSYSDGLQYSISVLADGANGRHTPTMTTAAYTPPQAFRTWAAAAGYATSWLFTPNVNNPRVQSSFDLYDMDRSGGAPTLVPSGDQVRAEQTYWDLDRNGFVSDDERDEDADGLTNYDEVAGPMTAGWWDACYAEEGVYPIPYVGTEAYDADSDGDGILDGADDQDFDDVPNIMELSRNMAGNRPLLYSCGGNALPDSGAPAKTYVNPFNPCLPDKYSRTCQRHPAMSAAYAPYIPEWEPFIRN